MIKGIVIAPALFTFVLAACGGTPGAHPHDMSAAQHEAMAARAEQGAALHQAEYKPGGATTERRCGGRSTTHGGDGVCWTSTTNPTAAHLEQAQNLRKIAADHRAASRVLRDAEAVACVGIPDEDRDMSPFMHPEDIASVEAAYEGGLPTGATRPGYGPRFEGALITLRPVPGLTEESLKRIIACHLARNAALGHQVPEMPNCPLVPRGVSAEVTTLTPAGSGFQVEIWSDDLDTENEILRRARTLTRP